VQLSGCITKLTKESNVRKLPYEKFDRIMTSILPTGWTFGYIGNVGKSGDDRSWMIYPPAQGISTQFPETKSIGGFCTDDKDKLLPIASGIAAAYSVLENLNNKKMGAI